MTVYLNHTSFINIELPYNPESSRVSITLGLYQKHLFINMMKKMCSVFQKKDVFYYDNETNELNVYPNRDENGNSNWLIKSQIGKNVIGLHPVVIYPEINSKGIEGIRVMVNSSENHFDLSYEDSIILIEMLKEINISILSNMIIDMVLPSYVNKLIDSNKINEISSKLDVLDESTSFKKRMEMINSGDNGSAIGKVAEEYRDKIERRSMKNGER